MRPFLFVIILMMVLCVFPASGKDNDLPISFDEIPPNPAVDETAKSTVLARLFQTPLHFVANQGQMDDAVIYYAKSEGATVYCTEQGLVFGFAEGSISLKFSEDRRVRPEARCELEGKVNHFIGNDPASWHTDIPTYKEVVYREVYPGIDLVYSGNRRRLKYTFYLQPSSYPNQILMIYDGIKGISVDDATGELVIQTPLGEMRDDAPVAYQEIDGVRKEIDISFRLIDEKSVGFAVGDYDPNFMLILDPGYSTYLGGSGNENSWGEGSIAVDSSGNVYVAGWTFSSDFPTQNPIQSSLGGPSDAFVIKLNSDGNVLVYSTYIGGGDFDRSNAIAVDSSGNVYVTGETLSSDFPTKTPFQGSNRGDVDAFVTKLNSNGNALGYSTYIGGSSRDSGEDIAVDSLGNVYVTGCTHSSNFPTQNPFQVSNGGGDDVFAAKLNSGGNTLIFSTYIGGSGNEDCGNSIVMDSSDNVYVTGYTNSSNFPTKNPFQGSYGGGSFDAFATKLNSSGNALVYSTYIGGSNDDYGNGIAVDSAGTVYVAGGTSSSDFPTQNPLQGSYGGGYGDAFVTKLNSSGNALVYSTYIGGSIFDYGYDIAVDSAGNVYVTGKTESSNFPTKNAYQGSKAGWDDGFVTKLNSSGSALVFSTYIGGSDNDYGSGIAVDGLGNVYVTGTTSSSDFPTQNPFQGSFGGGDHDAFVASFLSDGSQQISGIITDGVNPIAATVEAWQNGSLVESVDTTDGSYSLSVSGTCAIRAYSEGYYAKLLPILSRDYIEIDPNITPLGEWVIRFLDNERYEVMLKRVSAENYEPLEKSGKIGETFRDEVVGLELNIPAPDDSPIKKKFKCGDVLYFKTVLDDYYGTIKVQTEVTAPASGVDIRLELVPNVASSPVNPCDFWDQDGTNFDEPTEHIPEFVQIGDVITAKDPNGIICGVAYVGDAGTGEGDYFIHVNGDDPNTPNVDEGAETGDTISFFINGYPAKVTSGTPIWNSGGSLEVSLSAPALSFGDVSGNGKVTAYDTALILQHIRGLITLSADQIERGDVDGDGTLTTNDATLILQKVVGLISEF